MVLVQHLAIHGAGGGGAGGDDSSTFDSSGGAGEGGFAGQAVSQTIDTSAITGDIFIITTIGAGGAGSSEFDYSGASGSSGAVAYASPLGGTTTYTINDFIQKRIKKTTGGTSGFNSLNSTHTYSAPDITLPKGYYKIVGYMRGLFGASGSSNMGYSYSFQLKRDSGGDQTFASGGSLLTDGDSADIQFNWDDASDLVYFSGHDHLFFTVSKTSYSNGSYNFFYEFEILGPYSNTSYI